MDVVKLQSVKGGRRAPWRVLGSVVLGLLVLGACESVEFVAFPESDEAELPGVGGVGLGGGLSGSGGEPGVPAQTWLVDDFEDQDEKAQDPGGWWYIVNDGTGEQALDVVAASDGYILQIVSGTFSDWGSALGLDVANYDLPAAPTELEFYARSTRPFELSFHAIDGSGDHFTRPIFIETTWVRIVVRLDQMFFVDGDVVRRLDLPTLDELHWFFFESEPVTVWIDRVTLRSY